MKERIAVIKKVYSYFTCGSFHFGMKENMPLHFFLASLFASAIQSVESILKRTQTSHMISAVQYSSPLESADFLS